MPIKMKMGAAHNMLAILNRMDHDPNLRLKDTTRLVIAININRLLPDVQAYERARNNIYVKMKNGGGGKVDENLAAEEDYAMRDREYEFNLVELKLDDFKSSDGEALVIPGFAVLVPIIKDIES